MSGETWTNEQAKRLWAMSISPVRSSPEKIKAAKATQLMIPMAPEKMPALSVLKTNAKERLLLFVRSKADTLPSVLSFLLNDYCEFFAENTSS